MENVNSVITHLKDKIFDLEKRYRQVFGLLYVGNGTINYDLLERQEDGTYNLHDFLLIKFQNVLSNKKIKIIRVKFGIPTLEFFALLPKSKDLLRFKFDVTGRISEIKVAKLDAGKYKIYHEIYNKIWTVGSK